MSLRKLTSFTTTYTRATLNLSQRSLATAVRFHETGEASKVLKLEQLDANFINAKLGPNEIGLKFLAAPINPSDINIVSNICELIVFILDFSSLGKWNIWYSTTITCYWW
jgi:hypothetical protein